MPYYAVWNGRVPGVYDSWTKCQEQVKGFKGATFRKLKSSNYTDALVEFKASHSVISQQQTSPLPNFLTVDGACNGTSKGGMCEYRGVMYQGNAFDLNSSNEVFRSKVYPGGTNNIAEFLGLVEGIKYFLSRGEPIKIYTDSVTALAWVRNCKANSSPMGGVSEELTKLISEAEMYLIEYSEKIKGVSTQILKWNTKEWGEIPADFGRK
jgi:ribonuclease HI